MRTYVSSTSVSAAQATADAAAAKAANLSDLASAATARTNLSVPSTAEQTAAIAAAVAGLFDLRGTTDCSTNPNYPAASKGDAYVVTVTGRIGGAAGPQIAVGDIYFATADNAGGTHAAVGANWSILEHNLIVGADVQAWSAALDTLAANGAPGALGLADLAVVAPVNNPVSPYAVAAGVRRITTNAALTVQLPTSAVTVGEIVAVTNNSAAAIIVTFTAASIDGTTSVAISIPARGAAGAQLISAAVWGSVQPGAAAVGPPGGYVGTPDTVFAFGNEPTAVSETAWKSFTGGTYTLVA